LGVKVELQISPTKLAKQLESLKNLTAQRYVCSFVAFLLSYLADNEEEDDDVFT
jgi:hypothetical protein